MSGNDSAQQRGWRRAGRRGGALGCPVWGIMSAPVLQGRALHGSLSDGLRGSGSCSMTGHLQTYCAFLMSLVDSPGLLLF